ncbi:DUF1624 domain-containing protein [Guptibacillus hwajinpoensis]|uniref:DUF1624 domain-containing protein n=1 Tax=Guptibacillus hwajinpoensis TaxID=208199 RepID=UPI001CFD8CA9|nr:DUF1624 domain-containing protein [Pseudalkalibacillus hwajinpoensis]WLR58980.1 DUF1624 domain-containing protein [Pseudalkalibacillus hwajinpoensis]
MSQAKMSVGLVTPPGYPEKLSKQLSSELPKLLRYYVEDECEWHVDSTVDPLTGVTEKPEEVLEAGYKRKEEENWDYIVCLTDLPFFQDRKPIVAEASTNNKVAIISLPGLGSTPMVKRIRQSILQLVNEMYYGSPEEDREKAQRRLQTKENDEYDYLKEKGSKRLFKKGGFERFSPIKRVRPGEETSIDVRYIVKSRLSGAIRILTGMVRANRPWAIFPAFKKVIIFAFATGSYALVFPTLWQLSNSYGLWRMFMLMIVSSFLMVGWLVLAHNLWEKPRQDRAKYLRNLYNVATILTLLVTVSFYYIILFFMFAVAVIAFIPMGLLESQLSGPVGYDNYFYITWTATSISIIIGALGSALEDEEVVLSSTYGYRQQQRYKTANASKEEDKNSKQEETPLPTKMNKKEVNSER